MLVGCILVHNLAQGLVVVQPFGVVPWRKRFICRDAGNVTIYSNVQCVAWGRSVERGPYMVRRELKKRLRLGSAVDDIWAQTVVEVNVGSARGSDECHPGYDS